MPSFKIRGKFYIFMGFDYNIGVFFNTDGILALLPFNGIQPFRDPSFY